MERRIEKAWLDYRAKVVHPEASERQVAFTKRAFYSGALLLFSVLVSMLDGEGPEATLGDLQKMDEIQAEMQEYMDEIKAQYDQHKNVPH